MTAPAAPAAPPAPPEWRYSEAKKQLARDILAGKTKGKKPKQVHESRPMYEQYKLSNFRTNFTNLKATLEGLQRRAESDEAAFLHDEALNLRTNNKPYPRWGGSVAERFLKIDIDAGKHKVMEPLQLHKTRPEYSPYPLTVFRDHIHQELRGRRERPYWMARREEAEKKKKKKKKRG